MKITDLRTTVVSVPFRTPDGTPSDTAGITNVLLEIVTDEGLVGLGEAVGQPTAIAVRSVIEASRPALIGERAYNVERIVKRFYAYLGTHHYRGIANNALAAVEMALWDLLGKRFGCPAYQLLGGLFRARVSYFYWIPRSTPEGMALEAKQAVADGFDVLYFKVGFDPFEDEAALAAVREAAGPRVKIRIDANEAWTAGVAIQRISAWERYRLDFVEEPVMYRDVAGLAAVQAAVRVPVAANQSAWTDFDAFQIIARRAADVIVSDPHQVGGLLAFKKVAAMAEVANMPINKHSSGELGISTSASLHVAVTIPNLTDGNQIYANLLVDDVVEDPPRLDAGMLAPTDKPGLGVALNAEKVAKYAALYQERGQYVHPYFTRALGYLLPDPPPSR